MSATPGVATITGMKMTRCSVHGATAQVQEIRWLSPLGPMRFEYGYNLDARDYESDSKFDFMIGRFF